MGCQGNKVNYIFMGKKELRVLQLGKFYPVRGGVEKVAYDLMVGLSERHIGCDMMCAASQGRSRILNINEYANIICCHTWMKLAATMISPAMIFSLWKRCRQYDVIQIHHPDPMACLALFISGYKGKVILHWHSDIQKQKFLLNLYKPLQSWLLRRADMVVGTSPVYLAESPFFTWSAGQGRLFAYRGGTYEAGCCCRGGNASQICREENRILAWQIGGL